MTDVAIPTSAPASAPSNSAPSSPSGSSGPAPGGGQTQVIPSARSMEAGTDDGDPAATRLPADPSKPAKPRPSKHSFKRLGVEQQLEVDQALAMLGDDFEHEIPLGEEKRKVRFPDLVRGYQMSDAALSRMRQAAEIRKHNEELIEWGKRPENRGAFVEQHLGVTDHVQWASEIITAAMKDEAELQELLTHDPARYHRTIQERARQGLEKAGELKARKEQEERSRVERARGQKEMNDRVTEAFKAVRVPLNDSTKAAAGRIYQTYADVGYELPLSQLADMVRDEYVSELRGYVSALDDDGLLGLLGDGLRDKLRKLELKTLRGGKKQDPAETPRPSGGGGNGSKKGITASEFLRSR